MVMGARNVTAEVADKYNRHVLYSEYSSFVSFAVLQRIILKKLLWCHLSTPQLSSTKFYVVVFSNLHSKIRSQ
jgi:hypothetical protein